MAKKARLTEMLQAALQHARTMPGLAVEDNKCMYRTADGNRCLAGLFIPDAKYRKRMEGHAIRGVADDFNLGFDADEINLLSALQSAHDNSPRGESWRERLAERIKVVALRYDIVLD